MAKISRRSNRQKPQSFFNSAVLIGVISPLRFKKIWQTCLIQQTLFIATQHPHLSRAELVQGNRSYRKASQVQKLQVSALTEATNLAVPSLENFQLDHRQPTLEGNERFDDLVGSAGPSGSPPLYPKLRPLGIGVLVVSIDKLALDRQRVILEGGNMPHLRSVGMNLSPSSVHEQRFSKALEQRRVDFVSPREEQLVPLWHERCCIVLGGHNISKVQHGLRKKIMRNTKSDAVILCIRQQ